MLRYKTKTRPGLVALYDIQPGNGAGPFLQPRSPHGAKHWCEIYLQFFRIFQKFYKRKTLAKIYFYKLRKTGFIMPCLGALSDDVV